VAVDVTARSRLSRDIFYACLRVGMLASGVGWRIMRATGGLQPTTVLRSGAADEPED
jgi:hypothetical protein